jgi:CelD/BcsL family acetyltransferase involved in cellulose biosynthesis
VWTFDHLVGEVEKFEPYVAIRSRSPQMDLSGGFEQYLRGRREAGSEVARVESKARKIAREVGEPTFVLHDGSGEALAAMIGWKRAQYRRSGISDAFAVPWTSELLDRIAATQTPGFAGVCSALRVDGRIVAVHVGMRSDRVLHYWFPAYDPEFGKYSPGLVLVLRLAEEMSRAGVRAIDLGKGDSRYKESLMTGAVDLREGAVALPSLAASARKWRVRAEASAARGGLGAALRFPLRALRRVERGRKYR